MTDSITGSLPQDKRHWLVAVDDRSLGSLTIQTCTAKSGSKIELPQFLLLRALWPRPQDDEFFEKRFAEGRLGPHPSYQHEAVAFLKNLNSWARYIGMLKHQTYLRASRPEPLKGSKVDRPSTDQLEGTFAPTLEYQRLSCSTKQYTPDDPEAFFGVDVSPRGDTKAPAPRPHPASPKTPTRGGPANEEEQEQIFAAALEAFGLDYTPEGPARVPIVQYTSFNFSPAVTGPRYGDENVDPIEDEQIVNTAALLFLQALCVHYPEMSCSWSLKRYAFTLTDRQRKKIYVAQVDGILRDMETREPKVIIEVKPFARRDNGDVYDKIRMQETAQMAAWIAMHPPKLGRQTGRHKRMLLSQDRHQIYLIVASFDDAYVRYITHQFDDSTLGQLIRDEPFLVMNEFGPYNLNNHRHMRTLGIIMLSVSLSGGLQ